MINISNKNIKFNDLENKVWNKKMKEGIIEIKYMLKEIDKYLLKHKDNSKFIPKDIQKTTIKCKFGDVEIYRRRYKYKMNDNTVKNVYLLDEYLELGFYGQYSQGIVEMVMNEIVEKSYRKTAETIMNNTNVSISHNAARNIVLKVAEKKIKPYEEEKLKLYEQGIIEGNKEKDIIYEEADGIYISTQNRNKRKKKKSDKEVKIAVIHEGFEPRYSNDFKLVNKQIVVTTENAKKLKRLVDMTIGTTYKVYKIKKVVINADGAGWCKDIAQGANEKYQLDMFHIQDKIRSIISDTEYLKIMSEIVKTDKPEYIFNIIYNYKVELEYEQKQEELEKVKELEKYLKNNKEGLLRYQYELGYNIEELNNKYKNIYRNLGTEESQMYAVCRKRMKRNRTSWCSRGAEALIKVIAYVKNNNIKDLIEGRLEKEVENEVKSRFPQPEKIKKIKKVGKIKYCGKNTILESLTGIRKQYVKEMLRLRSFDEIRLIGD
jgi:hypothetical protein